MPVDPSALPRRRRLLRGLLILAGVLLAVIALTAAIGATLPVRHSAAREAVYPASRDSLYALITDVSRFTSWRSGLERVEEHPPVAGKARWVEVSGDGEILFEAVESVPAVRRVTRIADPELPFGGTWTFELEDAPEGTRVRITEDGEVYNPIFRFLSRFVFGHDGGIERFLADLGAAVRR
ncbi:MAG: SRPBCC family protein [Gemmatimonadota bacterium]